MANVVLIEFLFLLYSLAWAYKHLNYSQKKTPKSKLKKAKRHMQKQQRMQ